MLGRIAVNSLIRAPVNAKVGLLIAIEIQSSEHNRARNGLLEDSRAYSPALIDRKTWSRDIQRNDLHLTLPERMIGCLLIRDR